MLKKLRLIIPLLILGLSPYVFGQAVNATLLGTINDPSGATVAGVRVTVTEAATGAVHQTLTNESGNYTIPDLAPGTYNITAEAPGFKKDTHQNIDLLTNSSTRIDISMVTGSVSETVLVTTAPLSFRPTVPTSARRSSQNRSPIYLSEPTATFKLCSISFPAWRPPPSSTRNSSTLQAPCKPRRTACRAWAISTRSRASTMMSALAFCRSSFPRQSPSKL
ncbi:carboxypeptidase-like regulatory domain-containing protein [Tunturiibacter gelidiferens]|uniref:carboxypeptidase-like regulatory domain-containing protein n=1 Tax=Tunturiibacter gelidiferens TaxID=3069689 RepID=UPI003D9B0C1C